MTVISYYRITKEIELLPFGVILFCCLFVNMECGILIEAGIHHLLLLAYIGNRNHPELIRLPVSLIS
jgi:sodium-independent sulfate anion transporter 11